MAMPTNPPDPRRHDLDALRAAAMLLGLVYHAALSFAAGFPWLVQDASQSRGLYVFQAATHGFRMPLFFLISGFFTAMLWRKRGLKALLKQRFQRILLPCLLGLVTVVPAMLWVAGMAFEGRMRQAAAPSPAGGTTALWKAARDGDVEGVARGLAAGEDVDALDVQFGVSPLTVAVLRGDQAVVLRLLEGGAAVSRRNRDGNTPLHAAAFLGRTGLVEVLIARGADLQARSLTGDTAVDAARADWPTTQFLAGLFGVNAEQATVEAGRWVIVTRLEALGVGGRAIASPSTGGGVGPGGVSRVIAWLIHTPVFLLIWFLWYLCWLVAAFAAYAWLADRCGWKGPPRWLVLSPAGAAVWVGLTLLPGAFMNQGLFGPDTYMGLLPAPHVLLYYALFFGFGVLYYDADDQAGSLGSGWRWSLPLMLLGVFPLALEFATGYFGFRDALLPGRWHWAAGVLGQALYAWGMTFACMGLFRSVLTRENRALRYLSDAAYWLYLAHLPPIILLQMWVQSWPGPAWLKCLALTVAVTAGLLGIYDLAVRYTWLGRLLNGPRTRPGSAGTPTSPGGAVSR